MEIEPSIKEVYKNLRKDIVEKASAGGQEQRYRLLALGFLRGRSYETLEKKTEGDNLCPKGKETFYSDLAYCVACELRKRFGKEQRSGQSTWPETKEVSDWMRKRWYSDKEAA